MGIKDKTKSKAFGKFQGGEHSPLDHHGFGTVECEVHVCPSFRTVCQVRPSLHRERNEKESHVALALALSGRETWQTCWLCGHTQQTSFRDPCDVNHHWVSHDTIIRSWRLGGYG